MKIILLFLICSFLKGDNKIINRIDSENILVGEPIRLFFQANLDSLHYPRFPEIYNIDDKIEVHSVDLNKNNVTYTILIWNVGEIIFPPIPVEIIYNNQVIDTIATKEFIIIVKSTITENTENIKDIKSFREINISNQFFKYFLIFIIIISSLLIIYFYNKNYKINNTSIKFITLNSF